MTVINIGLKGFLSAAWLHYLQAEHATTQLFSWPQAERDALREVDAIVFPDDALYEDISKSVVPITSVSAEEGPNSFYLRTDVYCLYEVDGFYFAAVC